MRSFLCLSKITLLAMIGLYASACAPSRNDVNANGRLNGTISESASGTYTLEKIVNPTDPEWPSQSGCVTRVDPRLTAGMNFELVLKMQTDGIGFAGLAYEQTVQSVAADKINSISKIQEAVGILGVSTGNEFEVTCTLDSSGQSSCISNIAKSPDLSAHTKYNNCTVKQPTETKFAGSKGTYKFINDETVTAFQALMLLRGQVNCNGVDIGLGQIESTSIATTALPSVNFSRCDQNTIFIFQKVVVGNKILSVFSAETLQQK